ncbi:membrane protein [Microbacterium phage Schimmels22]|jgi:hypothetical protein|nr:membrane protein [Microbacterium phage Tinyman4]WNN96076.1 membrane protein [Microbacterium phage Schimmels22]
MSMPVWDWLWAFMVWGFYALAWVGALIILFAVAVGLYRGIKGLFPKRK